MKIAIVVLIFAAGFAQAQEEDKISAEQAAKIYEKRSQHLYSQFCEGHNRLQKCVIKKTKMECEIAITEATTDCRREFIRKYMNRPSYDLSNVQTDIAKCFYAPAYKAIKSQGKWSSDPECKSMGERIERGEIGGP